MTTCDVAIIGAGPYGLSIAAHLQSLHVNFRIFGRPMEFWLKHMPRGMHLKSEGFASSLYDPDSAFTLNAYCKERGLPYAPIGSPVPLETFTSYGLEFQKRFVPEVEEEWVTSLRPSGKEFELVLESGKTVIARRVVVAVGLTHYTNVPRELATLPSGFVTHSSNHGPIDHFKGREVAIVGGGSSAIDLAAVLHEIGASVQVLARVEKIRFHDPPENVNPSWFDRLRTPITGIGPGWKLFLCSNLPLVFQQMPENFRLEKVREILGPAPCWFTKEQVVGKVKFELGVSVSEAQVQNSRVSLRLTDKTGLQKTIVVDHVIAATGYNPNLQRLTFLDPAILSNIRQVEQTPVLSSNFESSVRNLYFVGLTSANTFGPLLRFAFGAGFAAPRLSRHLARTASGDPAVRGIALRTTEIVDREESPSLVQQRNRD
ncbi:MAG TPA: NAD(P)-binding domain-containing protein [Silvibacterium sp.]|nr:NAD(P)-binding domain-containing protein [Silvibacterium sp.]